MSAIVEFDGVVVERDGAGRVLDGLSLELHEGETLALIGRSGCGKTTALRLVNALLLPSAGSVRVEGRATSGWDPIELRRRCGYVIQETGLFPHRTLLDNVSTVPRLLGWPAERIAARAAEMFALVGLEASRFAARYPQQISGGQRQRIGVARALAADPPLLLLDEPFAALDPLTRRELQDEFRRLQARLGKSAIFVTHDLVEASRVADRIALLDGGRVVACGTVDELRRRDDALLRAFFEAARVVAVHGSAA